MTTTLADSSAPAHATAVLTQAARFPRIRYMGSKFKLAQPLYETFSSLGGGTFLDAFAGSGFVGYLAKAMGYRVTSNDQLAFPGVIGRASIANNGILLSEDLIEKIIHSESDGRDFIERTYRGIFYTVDDLKFLDRAWSAINQLERTERALALSALLVSCARKQPRGVFTISGDLSKYDDGRRDLRLPLSEHFRERAAEYNAAVIPSDLEHSITTGTIESLPAANYDIVYLDPPYAPPTDDADYTKRYHFLEGLATYWEGHSILEWTKTRKIPKIHSQFAKKATAKDAIRGTIEKFADSRAIVLSYSSNSAIPLEELEGMLRDTMGTVSTRRIDHTYHFGTHSGAQRRSAHEYILVGGAGQPT